jgi:ketosteroid isomerase-like protein
MARNINLNTHGKEIFQKVFDDIADSWNAGDRMPYVNINNDQSVYMVPNGELLIGKDAIKNFVFSFPKVNLQYTIIEVSGNPEQVIVRGTYILEYPGGNLMDKGKFLAVFKTGLNGKWIATHGIWNSDLPNS